MGEIGCVNPHIEKVNPLFNDITRQVHTNNSSVLIIYFNKNPPCLPERRGGQRSTRSVSHDNSKHPFL